MKRKSELEAVFAVEPDAVWEIVTDLNNTAWRSDLSKTERVTADRFTEYTIAGAVTDFIVTERIPVKKYTFTMKNRFFTGQWEGSFEPITEGTRLRFSETLMVRNPVIWALSFFAFPLKKVQRTYVEDLQKELIRRSNALKNA